MSITIRKAAIIALALAAAATAVFWMDSYRARSPRLLTPEGQELLKTPLFEFEPPDPLTRIGSGMTRFLGDRKILRIENRIGRLNVRYDSGIKTGTPVPRVNVEFLGFQHKQWMWTSSITGSQDGQPNIFDDYHVREIPLPFWALFAAFASYPTLALVRGPIRRWRRRSRGLCIRCAYNLTGNVSGVCPECGEKVQGP